ncbi:MAG: hypothetical protein HOJ34_08315 [Kordiimonadaceae bacterium]|jgi:hypothetical protein|nr:hypothetical protein [Kordiimonadaceae bacterium]MBT6035682.1 hypothetical protein [Kordiimonadaceae bacterium]MBT6329770.1 hypothetical protein [Kordiimonadaceae bacterium]MBT7583353.1 hypothetical protein [Kordiimonadaceae bacterium]
MTTSIIVYAAAIGQLYLLSYFYPKQIINRISHVLDKYPASTHPKLYPTENGEERAKKGLTRYKYITRSTLILGIILMVGALITKTEIKDSMVTLFAMLQFFPFMLLEIAELNHYKLMREENKAPKRSADLKRRNYFDYISPLKFSLAVIMFGIYITFNLYRNDFNLSFGSDGLITLVTIIGVHIYFAITVIWIMYGKKLDPHQEHKDRDRHIGGVVSTTYLVSIAVSTFLLIYGLLQHYSLDPWEPVALSIYFQLCAYIGLGTMLRTNTVENINFEVYKS